MWKSNLKKIVVDQIHFIQNSTYSMKGKGIGRKVSK